MRRTSLFVLSAVLFAARPAAAEEAPPWGALKVELAVAASIAERQPKDPGTAFPAETPALYAWTLIRDAKQPVTVLHVWEYEGEVQSVVPLSVTSSWFRTWSRMDLEGRTGMWTVRVEDPDRNVLARTEIRVGPAPKSRR